MPDQLDQWWLDRLNAAIPDGQEPWDPTQVADKLVAHLMEYEPDNLYDWMLAHIRQHVRTLVVDRARADRMRRIEQARVFRFQTAAKSFSEGDRHALDAILGLQYVVDETSGTRMALGEMTGADLLAAAKPYRRREAENAFQASFLEALASVAGQRRVREAVPVEMIHTLLDRQRQEQRQERE